MQTPIRNVQIRIGASCRGMQPADMSESSIPVSRLRVADPEGLVEVIRGSELEPWILNGHRRESELTRVMLPGCCLDQVEVGPAMWFRGAMPKDCYTMVFVRECAAEGYSFNFNTRFHGQNLAFYAPGEVIDAITPAGYRNATLTIPAACLQQAVESRHQEIPARLLQRGDSFLPSAEACRNLSTFLGAMEETITESPEVLAGGAARDALERELHDHFFDLILSCRDDGSPFAHAKITLRYRRMSLVRDFIRENSHRRIRLTELCAVSGLSRRGLEYLFVDLLGVRASAFLYQSRLHGVRRELLAAEPRHGLVKQHALNWGFWHLGRFAAEYRGLFGENPSTTLARRA